MVPFDRGLCAATKSGTFVLDCGIPGEQLITALDGRFGVREIAASLELSAASVRKIIAELDGAGLLAAASVAPRATPAVTTKRAAAAKRPCLAASEATIDGRGELARAVRGRLRAHGVRVSPRARTVVACVDRPGAVFETVARLATADALLVVHATEDGYELSWIGDHHDVFAGCACCAALFRESGDVFARLARERGPALRWRYAHAPAARDVAAALAVAEVMRGPVDEARQLVVDPLGASVSERRVMQHPMCPRASLGDVTADARRRDPVDLHELAARLAPIESAIGPIRGVQPLSPAQRSRLRDFVRARGGDPATSLIAQAHQLKAYLPALDDIAVGVDLLDATAAKALAIVESIERLAVFAPLVPLPTVRAPYRDVEKRAIDPSALPLYADHQYREPEFPLVRPDRPIDWMWGVDLATRAPVLVPADVVRPGRAGESIFACTSNGAACHSSFVHAVLNGLYELIERDAFMIAWLNRLSLPRCELAVDPLGAFAEWRALGMTLDFVDITTDLGIPVLLLATRDSRDPDRFIVTFSSGRSLATIATRLQKELLQFALLGLLDTRRRADEHFLWYQDRERVPLAAFLTASTATSAFAAHPHFAHASDADEELARLVAQLGERGHRAIVVDATTPWIHALGLVAVRVVVPGLQPMHFGRARRVLGGRRLYEAPRRMGIRDADTRLEDLNPWEHPFA